jgi:hypothetical protein
MCTEGIAGVRVRHVDAASGDISFHALITRLRTIALEPVFFFDGHRLALFGEVFHNQLGQPMTRGGGKREMEGEGKHNARAATHFFSRQVVHENLIRFLFLLAAADSPAGADGIANWPGGGRGCVFPVSAIFGGVKEGLCVLATIEREPERNMGMVKRQRVGERERPEWRGERKESTKRRMMGAI